MQRFILFLQCTAHSCISDEFVSLLQLLSVLKGTSPEISSVMSFIVSQARNAALMIGTFGSQVEVY